jgi:hypothetical protein
MASAAAHSEWCVDVENTGSHTQFFDKFTIRFHIAVVIKSLWGVPTLQDAVVRASQCVLLGAESICALDSPVRWQESRCICALCKHDHE